MNDDEIKIGGEFEINPDLLIGYSDFESKNDVFFYSSGRSSLMAILNYVAQTKPKVIHVPYYMCHTVIHACIYTGFKVCFYELDEKFLFPLEYSEKIKRGESLLTVNYFGFIDDNQIIDSVKKIRHDIVLISDHSQSYWTYKQSHADYSFTSIRKQLPLPDGAFIHSKQKFSIDNPAFPINNFYYFKLLASVMKWQKQTDKLYLDLFSEGERVLDKEHCIMQASLVSRFLLEKYDLDAMREQRMKNTKIIYDLGQSAGLNFVFDYAEDLIPLCVPILLKNRGKVRSEMMKKNIFLPIHWPISEFNTSSNLANQMASNSLSIIIDHRYQSKDMKFQVSELSNLIK